MVHDRKTSSLGCVFFATNILSFYRHQVAVLASSHNIKSLDPIDKVTILALRDYPRAQENLRSGWKTSNFSPFDPVSKRITAEVEKDGKRYTACKGAPNS